MLPDYVNSYLKKYEAGGWELYPGLKGEYKNIIIVPAIDEFENIKKLVENLSNIDDKYFGSSLFLFVINNTSQASEEVKANNSDTLLYLKQIVDKGEGLKVAYIDASTGGRELPEKDGGVGLARKMGMDKALTLFDYNSGGKNILVCLDADCTVSDNYLTSTVDQFNFRDIEVASLYFEHDFPQDEKAAAAIIVYEIFLRYYVTSLKFAGSAYAFHTIGSSMASTAGAYIKNEGMNRRKAAEDFYFLEKLSKNYNIHEINSVTVYPSSRGSWRVPFGTGQRVNRFFNNSESEYFLYNFDSFIVLKEWLNIYDSSLTPEELFKRSGEISIPLKNFLKKNSFLSDMNNIYTKSGSEKQLSRQKHKWFDGFMTLKLIHYLRDNEFKLQPMFPSVKTMLEKSGIDSPVLEALIPHIEIQKEYLGLLRDQNRNA